MAADAQALERARAAPRVADLRWRPSRWTREVGWRHLVALAACVFALFPVAYVLAASVNPNNSIAASTLFPANPTLDNYRLLLRNEPGLPYVTWLRNSAVIAGVASVMNVFFSALAAYAFSRLRFKGRRPGLLALLLIQMFPQLLAVVAIFRMMVRFKEVFPAIGLGTGLGLLLVYMGGALGMNTWLMKGFYDTIPSELDESAKVDGASHAQAFFLIVLPLVRPVLAVVGLLSFVFLFNEFIIASVLVRGSDAQTLPVGLQLFIDERYGSRWGPFAAGAVLGGIPFILLFLFLQRFIVSGLTAGAVKG